MAVILVSHSMEDVANYVERLVVLEQGEIAFDGTPKEVFCHREELEAMGLGVPQVKELTDCLRRTGWSLASDITTVEEAKREILALLAAKE